MIKSQRKRNEHVMRISRLLKRACLRVAKKLKYPRKRRKSAPRMPTKWQVLSQLKLSRKRVKLLRKRRKRKRQLLKKEMKAPKRSD